MVILYFDLAALVGKHSQELTLNKGLLVHNENSSSWVVQDWYNGIICTSSDLI
jgi:hypothetical protein